MEMTTTRQQANARMQAKHDQKRIDCARILDAFFPDASGQAKVSAANALMMALTD